MYLKKQLIRSQTQWMIFLNKGGMMIKEKYNQLFLSLQFGGIRTITIHRRCVAYKERPEIIHTDGKIIIWEVK